MILILLVGVALLALAVALVLRGVAEGGARSRDNLAQIGAYGFGGEVRTPVEKARSLRHLIDDLAGLLGSAVDGRVDRTDEAKLRQQLYSAGLYGVSPRRFIGYRLIATGVLGGGWIFLVVLANGNLVKGILFAFASAGLGWYGIMFVVKRRAAARLQRIDHDMPEFVDLLVTAVEGGMAFTAALQMTSRSFDGPLGQELRLAVQEQSMGLTITEALSNLLARCDAAAVRSFVQAIIQGESLGVSMGKILRDLAGEMRRRRRQAAEERAHKAGTKIIFPVALLIFPSLFLVTLVPVLVYLVHGLRGGS